MTDPIEDAARRLVELERSCWRRGLNMAHPVAAEELREILREVRRQALEDAARVMCGMCWDFELSVRSAQEPAMYYHPTTRDHGSGYCNAGAVRGLAEATPGQSSSKSPIVDPGANAEATDPSSKP